MSLNREVPHEETFETEVMIDMTCDTGVFNTCSPWYVSERGLVTVFVKN